MPSSGPRPRTRAASLDGALAALGTAHRQSGRHRAPAAARVHDVDGVVAPVAAGDPERHAQPLPGGQLPLPLERPREDERAALDAEIVALGLEHAVDVDLERPGHVEREVDQRTLSHATTVPKW